MTFLIEYYFEIKALHIIFVISWMAGLFYLPRLFVYHSQTKATSETSETFKIMERKLLRFITTPAMILSFVFGTMMLLSPSFDWGMKWIHYKLLLVLFLAGFHGSCAVFLKKFAQDQRPQSERFFRFYNEIPTLLMIAIVFLVILKPF